MCSRLWARVTSWSTWSRSIDAARGFPLTPRSAAQTYLVTGVAGFIGGAVARRLLSLGHSVVGIDNLSTGFAQNIPNGVTFVRGDVQDASVYTGLPAAQYAAIYHIAGQSSGEVSFDNPAYDLQTNTQSTLLLLKWAREQGCRRFLYASSMSVYGDQPDAPVGEGVLPTPKSFYGVGKLASEHYLRIYSTFGIGTAALRLFNVYGPGQNLENLRQGMVSIYLAQAIRTGRIVVKGDRARFRDFVYIEDVVDAFCGVEDAMATPGYRCYNVGTGVKTTVGELLDALQSLLPKRPEIEHAGGTPGDMFGIRADCSLIQAETTWRSRWTLDRGLREMVRWAALQ